MNPEKPEPGESLPSSREGKKTSKPPFARGVFRKTFPPQRKAAFEREVLLLQTLERNSSSKSFPNLISFGEIPGEGFYLDLKKLKGKNLHQIVAEKGPLPSGEILKLLNGILPILQDIHRAGIVHGDLSPSNLFLTTESKLVLLDFEKARFSDSPPIEGETEGFSGGTHGFAPKEAYLGAKPTHAFDLYALGGILHFLLVGQIPPLDSQNNFLPFLLHRLRPVTPVLLLETCKRLLSSPALRPSLEEIASLIKVFPSQGEEMASLETFLLGAPCPNPGFSPDLAEAFSKEIHRRNHWGKKLKNLLDKLPQTPPGLSARERLIGAWEFTRLIKICLSHLPLLELARERLSRASKRIPELLQELPESFRQLRDDLQFAEAKHLARLSINLCEILAGIPMDHPDLAHLIADTSKTLHASYQRMEHEEKNVQQWERSFQRALEVMDFEEAKRSLNKIGDYWSGANPTIAKLRDRLHRAEWLANQMARGRESLFSGLQILGDQAPATPEILKLMASFPSKNPAPENAGNLSINRLARTLLDYQETFPRRGYQQKHQQGHDLRKAFEEVQEIRTELTLLCHHYAKRMEDYLRMDPVPLRPILRDLAEADRILFLDSLVDLKEKTRGELYDQLDALRIRIEALADKGHWLSARAKDQAERGRLTTALYDMERALEASRGADEAIKPILSEVERLKNLRESLLTAQKQNRKLAEDHQKLLNQKAPVSLIKKNLDQREEVLHFLAENDPGAKNRWKQTLKDLKEQRVEIFAMDWEEKFHLAKSPQEKLAVCDSFYQSLEGVGIHEIPQRISDRWRSFASLAEGEIEKLNEERKQKSFLWQLFTIALAILALIIGLIVFPLL